MDRRSGFSIIEFITATALFVIIVGGLSVLLIQGLSFGRQNIELIRATSYANEGIAAVKSIVDEDYSGISNGVYGLSSSGGNWVLAGNNDTSGKYTRTVTIEDGLRSNDEIVESGGSSDPDTKKVTVAVHWNFLPSQIKTISQTTYITNWQDSIVVTPTPGMSLTPTPALTGTPTPTTPPGVTNTPVPTASPTPASCLTTCQNAGSTTATCRRNVGQCNANGETNISSGNQYCTGGPNADTCCCK